MFEGSLGNWNKISSEVPGFEDGTYRNVMLGAGRIIIWLVAAFCKDDHFDF